LRDTDSGQVEALVRGEPVRCASLNASLTRLDASHVRSDLWVVVIRWASASTPFDVSTDAFQPYESAIDAGLYDRASHSQVVRLFSHHVEEVRPAKLISVAKDVVSGNPDLDRAGTSQVERKNGTLRQRCKRLTQADLRILAKVGQFESASLAFCAL
jgi:hypothetical protein